MLCCAALNLIRLHDDLNHLIGDSQLSVSREVIGQLHAIHTYSYMNLGSALTTPQLTIPGRKQGQIACISSSAKMNVIS